MSDQEQSKPAFRSDADLLAEFVERRVEGAFAEIVGRHGGMVLSVCRSVLGNTPDAEDAAQAVFLTLARKANSTAVRARLAAWLHRVAWYVAARGVEARAIRHRHEQEAARMKTDLWAPDAGPIQLDVLHASLAKLPEKYRAALILHHLEGRSHVETAAVAGCSVEAVAVRLHRGREMLRKRIGRSGVVASAAALAGAWGESALACVPPEFAELTAKAATAVLHGPLTSAAILSERAMSLSDITMKMLFRAKLRMAATLVAVALLAVCTIGISGAALLARGSSTPESRAPLLRSPATGAAVHNRVVTGRVSQVGEGSITIQPRIGDAVTVAIDASTVVKVDDRAATAADLKVDMSAGVFFENGKAASEIRAYTPRTLPGL